MNAPRPAARPEDVVAATVRDDVRAMAGYHVPDAAGFVKLDAMENPYRLPEALQAELGRRLAAVAVNRYPVPSYGPLKAGLCAAFGVPDGHDVVLGNGSDELIAMLATACARPGACVLAPEPGFVMYRMSAQFAGLRHVGVPLAADFSLDLPAMLAALERERPAIVWLAYPNNPTGNLWDDAAIEAIVRAAPGWVVIDEAYQPFASSTWMGRLGAFPNLAVMRTVSKLGLAGLRLGYLAAPAPLLAELEKVRPPYNVNVLTEAAMLFALEHLPVFDAQAAALRADRQRLQEALAALPGVQPFPSEANFVLARVPDAAALAAALRARRVLVKDVSRMHPLLARCLRLTVGTPAENAALLEAMRAGLAG